MLKLYYLFLTLSLIKEYINIPFMELNQLAILFTFFVILWVNLKSNNKKFVLKTNNAKIFFIMFFILLFFVSFSGAVQTLDFESYIRSIKNLLVNIITFYLISLLSYKDYKKVIRFLAYISAFFFLFEYFLYRVSLEYYTIFFNLPYQDIRHTANFLSPNSYSITIAFITIWLLFESLQKRNIICFVLAVLLLLPFSSTASKSGMFVLIIGIGYIVIFSLNSIKRRIFALFSIGISFFLLGKSLMVFLENHSTSYFARRLTMYLEDDNIFGSRSNDYIKMFDLFQSNWFTGIGYGNINGGNSSYISDISSPHNEYLRFFLEGGFFAGMLFLISIFFIVFECFILLKKYPFNKKSVHRYVCFVIIFLVSEFFYNYFNVPRESVILITFSAGVFTLSDESNDDIQGKSLNDNGKLINIC